MDETTTRNHEKLNWQTPSIDEMDFAVTEAIYNPVPSASDGAFYTH